MTFSTRTTPAALRTLVAGGVAAALAAMTVVVAAPARAADPPPGPPVFGAVTTTSTLGVGGAVPRVVSCPDGSVLTTITATQTTGTAQNPLADWLNGVSATCSPVVVASTVGLGPAAPAGSIKGVLPSGPSTDTPCPAGSVATGLQGAGGALVDRVALRCAALSPTGTLGAVTVGPEAGGPGGGAQGPFDCPDGAVATGLAGRTGDDLDALGLICRPLGFPSVAPEEVNTSWPTALTVGGNSTATGTLRAAGQDRWFRFAVQPGSRVQVDLSALPADYDLTLFKDIGTAFNTLTGPGDLTKLSAEFASDAFSPSVFSPSVFSPSVFSPSVFSPSVFSPSVFSPSVFSPSVFSPSVFSPSVFSPAVSLPSVFSPSVFSPSVFSPSVFSEAFASAQTRSLIAVSAHDGTAPESISASTWDNTGFFYVRVQGRNGASAPSPFTLSVATSGGPCGQAMDDFAGTPTLVGSAGPQTVILTDSSRMAGTSEARTTLAATVSQFAGTVGGAVVDLAASPRVAALNGQADRLSSCPFAKNLVAGSIRDIVNSYRSSALKYVVVVGDDSVVPFFRYPDGAGLGPESGYVPPVADTSASQASLRNNYLLSQDAYGARTDVSVKGTTLPVPDLAVGRLVETPEEITATLQGYLNRAGAPLQPRSSLVTGYDFLTDAADAVEREFEAGMPAGTHDSLVTDQDVPPSTTTVGGTPSRRTSWTAADLSSALFGHRHDLVFLAGHFSANSALAADYSTSVLTTQLADAPAANFRDTILFSAGCHSGYDIVDREGVPDVTVGLDWTQAAAQKGATLIAGTGYQYGDTDFLDYSERLYASFARELRTGTASAVAVGSALVQAKQDYLSTTPTLRGIDTKAVLEATLFGLPMLGVDLPGRVTPPAPASDVTATPVTAGPGNTLGLQTAPLQVQPTLGAAAKDLTSTDGGTVRATWLTGPDGVDSNPAEPVLPVVNRDVTVPGQVLRGVGFRTGTYADTAGITPLTGAPATESSSAHTPFVSPAFFPGRLATPNYYDALGGDGSTGRTRLALTPAQHRSDAPGSLTDTRRAYSALGLQLYYSANTTTYAGNTPALAAAPAISGVSATAGAGSVTVSARAVGDPSAGMQQLWVTYTGEQGTFHGRWQSLDLTQDPVDSTLWSGTITLPAGQSAADVRFLIQAVNGVGLVTMDDNQGLYFTPGITAGGSGTAGEATTLSLAAGGTTGQYGSLVPVSATLSSADGPVAGRAVTFSLGGSARTATTNASGVASTSLALTALPGAYPLTAAFDGDAVLAASAAAPRSFTVTKQATALSLAAAGTDAGGVVAVLTAGGLPLRDKTVFVTAKDTAGGVLAVTPVPTDPSGRARLEAARLPVATATVSAQFAGSVAGVTLVDPTYEPSVSGVVVAPSLVTSTLPAAVLNGPYSTVLAVAGTATVRLTATGLPPGISLVAGAGGYTLTGTPTRAGAYPVLLTVDNGITVPRTTRLVLVVGYRLPNFLQPVNDPPGDNMSTFNVKSTVPVKFVLTDATGARIPDAEAAALAAACQVRISAPAAGSTGEPVDEPVVVGAADSGTCFRYDATAHQFIYNANSANLGFKAGRTYNLTAIVRAPTGEVLAQRSVLIGFR